MPFLFCVLLLCGELCGVLVLGGDLLCGVLFNFLHIAKT